VAAPPAPAAPIDAFVVGQTAVRKLASDDRQIPDPAGGDKPVANWVATLGRGERVGWLAENGDWSRVVLSDQASEGWVRSNRLVKGVDGVVPKLATLHADGKVFTRPELVALDADRVIPRGAVLFVLGAQDPFVEVDYPRSAVSSTRAWTLASDLVTDRVEVEAAKVVAKVLELRANQDEAASKMEELARTQFAASPLLSLLDAAPSPPPEPAPQ
jgi:hypothetical protein